VSVMNPMELTAKIEISQNAKTEISGHTSTATSSRNIDTSSSLTHLHFVESKGICYD